MRRERARRAILSCNLYFDDVQYYLRIRNTEVDICSRSVADWGARMGEPMKNEIQLFEDQKIRVAWDAAREEWYFSIVDVVGVLTDSPDYNTGRKYWNKLKQRLKDEGSELVTNCHQLKMRAADGKNRLTDVADTEQLLRIIQSIPSKKAEPFKAWLAMVGRERIEETIDPEQAIDRALETYLK